MGVIYTATNLVNGKVYVGKTIHDPFSRWNDHKLKAKNGLERYFHKSIRKHGADNFKFEVVDMALLQEELDCKEIEWIARLDSANPLKGYNCTAGGDGAKHTDASRCRISRARTPEVIEKWRTKMVGRKLSPEHRAKMSKAHLGQRPSEETRRRWAERRQQRSQIAAAVERPATLPHVVSEETKRKLSEAKRRWWIEHPEMKKELTDIARNARWAVSREKKA